MIDRAHRFGGIVVYIRRSRLEEYARVHRNQIPERKARSLKRILLCTKILEFVYEINFSIQPRLSMYTGEKIPIVKTLTNNIPDVHGRPRPNELRKWEDFIPQQMIIWDKLMQSEFHLERHFSCMAGLEDFAEAIDVESFMLNSGRIVCLIIDHINKNPALRASLGLTGSIILYQNHDEIFQLGAMADKSTSTKYPPEYFFCQHDGMSDEKEPDLESAPERRVFFIFDHKLPFDLRYDEFKDIIQPMDFNLVDCDSEKSDPKERLRRTFATFITEAYSHMIEEKVEYGCVTTGEITIFLRVLENDGYNIYYHTSAPKEDLEDFGQSIGRSGEPYTINRPYLTTLGQFFAFTIQAMKSNQRSQNWCKNIFKYSKKWGKFDNDLPMNPSDSEDDQSQPTKEPINQVSAEYCTHKCLHGLKNGGELDKACPNWRDHGSHSHLISHSQFIDSMYNQLAKDLDTNIERICTLGSCGVPFKIRLASHGYTLFAKFTPSWFVYCLQQEASIYDRMESIQGTNVPVHLGNIDLKYPYFFGRGVKLVHAMFLSFGGSQIDDNILAKDYSRISRKVVNTFHKIHELYILHQDAEPRNILLDGDTGQVIVIDFERAEVVKKKPIASPKTKRTKAQKSKVVKSRVHVTRKMEIFKDEISYVRSALKELLGTKSKNH